MLGEQLAAELAVSEETILDACSDLELPEMGVIEQQWDTDPIPPGEVSATAAAAVSELDFGPVPDGGDVAIGVGSRGIANLPAIVTGVVEAVRELGFEPFVFTAMGSHGGATGTGQREMLETLGITEEAIGCEIRSSVEVTQVGTTPSRDVPVFADVRAASADGIIPINRIKPHTDFDGRVESGLSKMLVIGMGNQRGAQTAHTWAVDWSLRNMIPEITEQLLETLPVLGGVAVLEDQHDDTDRIEGIRPDHFLSREAELLERAYDVMPKLPFEELDVVIFDRQGKNVSGQGMDTNVIGRRPFSINEPEPETPRIKRIFTRRLTAETHGNAMGMGSADFVHGALIEQLDPSPTLINALTASTTRGVRIPPVVETDRAGLVAALSTIGVVEPDTVRVIRATDTMHLHRVYASSALVEEAKARDDLRVVEPPSPIEFEESQFSTASPVEGK